VDGSSHSAFPQCKGQKIIYQDRINQPDVRFVDLSKIRHSHGDLTFIEGDNHVPLDVERFYYL
jgi:hypothetical protein